MPTTKSWSHRLLKAGLLMAAGAVMIVVFAVAMIATSEQSKANRAFQRETHKPCGFCHVPGNEPELARRGRQYRDCGYSTSCWGEGGGGEDGSRRRHRDGGGQWRCHAWAYPFRGAHPNADGTGSSRAEASRKALKQCNAWSLLPCKIKNCRGGGD